MAYKICLMQFFPKKRVERPHCMGAPSLEFRLEDFEIKILASSNLAMTNNKSKFDIFPVLKIGVAQYQAKLNIFC